MNVIGLMCIPSINSELEIADKMQKMKNKLGLAELSMGMSFDYLQAIKFVQHLLELDQKSYKRS